MTAGVKKVSFSLTKKQKKHCNLLLLVVTFGIVTDTVCWWQKVNDNKKQSKTDEMLLTVTFAVTFCHFLSLFVTFYCHSSVTLSHFFTFFNWNASWAPVQHFLQALWPPRLIFLSLFNTLQSLLCHCFVTFCNCCKWWTNFWGGHKYALCIPMPHQSITPWYIASFHHCFLWM